MSYAASPSRLQKFARVLRKRQTRHEVMLWEVLRAGKLGGLRFRRQVVIQGYILDFYCDEMCLGIEVDHLGHDRGRDAVRDTRIFNATHVNILRFSNADVEKRMHQVVKAIAVKCKVSEFPQFPQAQVQQYINNNAVNLKSYWHGGNVENSGNLPDLNELTVRSCEKIVDRLAVGKVAGYPQKSGTACGKQVYSSMEVAETTVQRLSRMGIIGKAEKCERCRLIHVLEFSKGDQP